MTMPLDPVKAKAYKRQLSILLRGRKLSEEHKKKLSEAKLKNPVRYWLGKKRSEHKSEYNRLWRERNKEIIKKKYSQTRKIQRQKDLEDLAGRPKPESCEVCGEKGRICFDHCHQTMKFRGWLCEQCNVILGYARDNPKILKSLADYLENFNQSIL